MRSHPVTQQILIVLVRGVSGEPLEAAVEIRVKAQTGDWHIWGTPANACTVTLASNVCWYFEIPDAYYRDSPFVATRLAHRDT